MSIKKKLILIAICVVIIIVVFTVNVLRKVRQDHEEPVQEVAEAVATVSYAEAVRLLSYLDYDKTEREELPIGIKYASEDMSGWYDEYMNAAWKMGLIDEQIETAPSAILSYGSCKELIDKLIINKPEIQTVYQNLSFNFTQAGEGMPMKDFLQLYEAILAAVPEADRIYSYETLLVLGREVTEDGKDRMVTDQGKYYYLNAKSYEEYLGQTTPDTSGNTAITGMPGTDSDKVSSNATGTDSDKVSLNATGTDSDKVSSDTTGADNDKVGSEALGTDGDIASSDAVDSGNETSLIEQYMDTGIKVLTCGQELIYVSSIVPEQIVIHNVWIKHGEGIAIDTFAGGIDKSFEAALQLSTPIDKVIGDITVENRKVIRISVKPDMIKGKVLRTGEDFIEIDGYGEIPLEEDYKIYKIYGNLSLEPTGSILVGYETTDFIVSGGKISAALITESIKAENIRVLIKTTEYKDIYHSGIELTADDDFTVGNADHTVTYAAGEIASIKPGDQLLGNGRIKIKTVSGEGRIQILSLERSCGNPKYHGTIEVTEDEKGLLVINELPLEEYLYAVLPSEMPTSYGAEALKVQAVCARSYAYKHLLSNSLSDFGAHVDDSVSYQVYNNIAENEDSILAVKDTYGKIAEYEGNVITAYYFSTSCGHTAVASEAWANDIVLPYLEGKLLTAEDSVETMNQNGSAEEFKDLSQETNFRSFLKTEDISTYDSSFGWFRWKVSMKIADLKKVIDANLGSRYLANPELILTKTGTSEEGEDIFEAIPVDTVGTIVDITVLSRESSGLIKELLITGSKNTIKVFKEYNVRALLAPVYDKVVRQDESEVENLSLLPSAFFVIDKKEKDGQLSSITISGGGYGHGVGLSQNAVKAMVDSGKDYEYIVKYFYKDTEIGFIYE